MFSKCQNVSKDDSQDLRKNLDKDSDSEAESRDLTQNDSSSHFSGNGSCGWIRTNDLVVNSHPLYRWATQDLPSREYA